MGWAELLGGVAVISATLVHVLDNERQWRARGLAFEDTGDDAYFIRLAALAGVARLARAAAVQIVLDVCLRERQSRRHAIDDAANGKTVAFAPGGEAEAFTETIAWHNCC